MDLITQREIEQAKNVLRKFGYAVDNLWHISEIKSQYNCTDEEAFKVLNGALKNVYIMVEIRFAIGMHADIEKLEKA
jgi:hypothetical protein